MNCFRLLKLTTIVHCFCHSEGNVSLIKQHAYYCQLQGLMATAQVQWCNFVVFTNTDLHVERVYFYNDLWKRTMVPDLTV